MNDHSNTKQIEAAILKAWPSLPTQFSGRQLTMKVYRHIDIDVYADTILHTLRFMRRDGKISYICINRTKSQYEKSKP